MEKQDRVEYLRKSGKIAKVVVDRPLCIGAASCIAVAASAFALDDESKAVATDLESVDDETLLLSAQSCPTRAIFLYDREGKQVYP